MDDLVQWLRVQLDEDERIARAVEDRSAPWDGQWMADGNSAVRTVNRHVLFYRHGPDPLKPGLADHVAEWDPARVLREIDAKQRTLIRCEEEMFSGIPRLVHFAKQTVREMALPYAEAPGYTEALAAYE